MERELIMRMTAFAGSVVFPLSVILLAVAGLSTPPAALQSMLALVAIGAIGFMVLTLARRAYGSRHILALASMDDAARIAKDDASALARMESDAG
jgi:hypothetical protein